MLSRFSAGRLAALMVMCLGLMSGAAYAQGSSLTISNENVDGLATATFSIRIDDDELSSGENHIHLTVTDSQGRSHEATTSVVKRLF